MRFLVAVAHDTCPADRLPEYLMADAPSPEEAIQAVRDRLFQGQPLGSAVTINAVRLPDQPVRLTRLADLAKFEAELMIRLPISAGEAIYDGQ